MNLIVGAGAVGTILATYLKAAGRPVRLLIRERDRAAYEAAPEIRTDAINGGAVVAPERLDLFADDVADRGAVLVAERQVLRSGDAAQREGKQQRGEGAHER